MVPDLDTRSPRGSTESGATFVCPFCETTFSTARRSCSRCGGTLVVPVDETEVYETVLPMCGPDCHLNGPDGESTAGASDGLGGTLSRLPTPRLSAFVSPLVDRVCPVSRRT